MPHEYAAFLERLYELVPDLQRRRRLGALPRRPRAGGRELVRGRPGRRAPGRVRDQRHRRAGGQRLARGDRDAAAHARGDIDGLHTGIDTTEIARTSRLVSRLTGYAGAAEQGDRRPQRVRARVRHPPGRRAEGAHDLRDHGRDDGRARRQPDRARQALRPPRAARGARGAGLHRRRAGAEHGVQALQGDRGQEEAGHARWTSRRSSPTSCARR